MGKKVTVKQTCTFVLLCTSVFRTNAFARQESLLLSTYTHSEVQWNAVIYIRITMLLICFSGNRLLRKSVHCSEKQTGQQQDEKRNKRGRCGLASNSSFNKNLDITCSGSLFILLSYCLFFVSKFIDQVIS